MTESKHSTEELSKLVFELKKTISTFMFDNVSGMLDDADDQLFQMAEDAISNEESTRCYELMRSLRRIKGMISKDFIKALARQIESNADSAQSDAGNGAIEELSLVGQQEMEDMVIMKSMAMQAAGSLRERLSHLEMRLEELARKTPDSIDKNALDPISFCQAFNDALGYSYELAEKKILFKFFAAKSLSKLADLYDRLNALLIDAGILPQIKLVAGKPTPSKREPGHDRSDTVPDEGIPDLEIGGPDFGGSVASAGGKAGGPSGGQPTAAGDSGSSAGGQPAATGGTGSAAGGHPPGTSPYASSYRQSPTQQKSMPSAFDQAGNAVNPNEHGSFAMTASPGMAGVGQANFANGEFPSIDGASTDSSVGNTGANSVVINGTISAGNNNSYSKGTGDAASSGGHQSVYTHTTAGMPAGHVDQVLTGFFGAPISSGIPNSPDQGSVAGQTSGNHQYLGHEEILDALSVIQKHVEFADTENLRFDADAVKQSVIEAIAKRSGGVVTKRINQIAEKTIDFIEMIFDAIIEDDTITDTVKALLLRLQIPVIKASMLDQEFFIYDDHPARILLDKINEVGIGITDHENDIYVELEKIVNELNKEYEFDTGTFERALDKLYAFIEEKDRVAREKEEEEQKRVLKEHARNTVLKTLRSVTKGKRLPEAVHALVLRRWPTLMFNHYIDNGKENDEWVRIVEILRDIIESVQPIETAEDLARLKAEREELSGLARDYLGRTRQSKQDLGSIIDDLNATYDQMEEQAEFEQAQIESAAEALEASPLEKPALPEVEQAPKQKLPPNIAPGMWFKVHMSEDARPRRCKLSVIIMEDSKLVFVNYAGEVLIEKSFDEFTEELETYQSKAIMGHSVFDHALHSAVNKVS